jgi:hypothetical protein
MRILLIASFAFLLAGCASSQRNASLNAEQARDVAIRLANDKASATYHCRPFHDGQPARFVAGHWVWTDEQGYGLCDLQATVELAINGLTNSTDIDLLDNRNSGIP